MGYHALLFCPDEKTARTVTQVLGELDFAVTPCTEPFGAVKKLMGEHFDAVVVDCDNEQNATLLFKSARNTAQNQSALAVAVVEGQAGVAKAFRIGANLVLTKPINVEQAKGTLRVARGLLRKNEGAKPATATTRSVPSATAKPPAPPSPSPIEAATSHVGGAHPPAPPTPFIPATTASLQPEKSVSAIAASTHIVETGEDNLEATSEEILEQVPTPASAPPEPVATPAPAQRKDEPKLELVQSRKGFGITAASAPAPAREPASVSPEKKAPPVSAQVDSIAKPAEVKDDTPSIAAPSAPAPAFTFGGTISTEAAPASGGSKKWLFVTIAALLIAAAGGYAAWMHWGRPTDSASVSPSHVEPPTKTAAPALQTPPSPPPVAASTTPDLPASDTAESVPSHPSKTTAATDSPKPSAVTDKTSSPKEEVQPIIIKNNHAKAAKSLAANDAPAPPSITGIAPVGNSGLPNLMDSHSDAPTPILQRVNVSQGVSRGLLIKEVPPKYPSNALRLRMEGPVQLLATVSKDGDISAVKLLSGDQQLAHAAIDAVKQWKYKPYLLNGSPVEIQTQITVIFKLPK